MNSKNYKYAWIRYTEKDAGDEMDYGYVVEEGEEDMLECFFDTCKTLSNTPEEAFQQAIKNFTAERFYDETVYIIRLNEDEQKKWNEKTENAVESWNQERSYYDRHEVFEKFGESFRPDCIHIRLTYKFPVLDTYGRCAEVKNALDALNRAVEKELTEKINNWDSALE